MKSPRPARKAATASAGARSRTNVTRAGSTPWRRSTVSIDWYGVGAPVKEIAVRPTMFGHANRAGRRRDDPCPDPWPRRLRATEPRGEGQHGAAPPARLRTAALLRDADLPARSTAHRLRALLLHVLDLRGAAVTLSRGSLRGARGARSGRWPPAAPRPGPDRDRARVRAHGMGGAPLEPAGDPILRAARRAATPRLGAHATRPTGHQAPEP